MLNYDFDFEYKLLPYNRVIEFYYPVVILFLMYFVSILMCHKVLYFR